MEELKFDISSINKMIRDGALEYVLSSFDDYLDFLEHTWFYEGDVFMDNMYIENYEPLIIKYYQAQEGGEN